MMRIRELVITRNHVHPKLEMKSCASCGHTYSSGECDCSACGWRPEMVDESLTFLPQRFEVEPVDCMGDVSAFSQQWDCFFLCRRAFGSLYEPENELMGIGCLAGSNFMLIVV